jgi:aryl-alcohol dehydrogenase-like predicted oxidoreductase
MSGVQLALGTVQFGMAYGIAGNAAAVAAGEVETILRRARQAGVEVIDTAPGYGDIEQRLGVLAGNEPFTFVSKIPALPADQSASRVAEFVKESAARSMGRLGSRLKILLFHRAADLLEEHADRVWRSCEDAVRGAGIRLGVSAYTAEEAEVLGARFPIEVAQVPGNAFDQRLRDSRRLEKLEIHLRSAFLQGLLLIPRATAAAQVPAASEALRLWENWCQSRALEPLEAALGIVKALPGVRQCVVGVDSSAQFEQIVGAWNRAAPVDAAELALRDVQVIDPRLWPKR